MLNTGIVSNCWNFYLQNNVGLRDLIGHAADLEMRDIESVSYTHLTLPTN